MIQDTSGRRDRIDSAGFKDEIKACVVRERPIGYSAGQLATVATWPCLS